MDNTQGKINPKSPEGVLWTKPKIQNLNTTNGYCMGGVTKVWRGNNPYKRLSFLQIVAVLLTAFILGSQENIFFDVFQSTQAGYCKRVYLEPFINYLSWFQVIR